MVATLLSACSMPRRVLEHDVAITGKRLSLEGRGFDVLGRDFEDRTVALRIEVEAPESVIVGKEFSVVATMTSTGSDVARDVILVCQPTKGIALSDGSDAIVKRYPKLLPRHSRTVKFKAKAVGRGLEGVAFSARGSNSGEAAGHADVRLLLQSFKAELEVPETEFIRRAAPFSVTVHNDGDVRLHDLGIVTEIGSMEPVQSKLKGGTLSPGQIQWLFPSIDPGQRRRVEFQAHNHQTGTVAVRAGVICRERLFWDDQDRIIWQGVPAVQIELNDMEDAIRVGDFTTFTLQLKNQGTSDANDVRLVCTFPVGLQPTASNGEGRVVGQEVRFEALKILRRGESRSYQILVAGRQQGNHTVRLTFSSAAMAKPLVEEESTRVY